MNADSSIHYDESKVKTLEGLKHIRARPGMYVGRLGNGAHPDDGIYVLLKEVVDNSIDEYIMGYGKKIDVSVLSDGHAEVRDYGRGIPLGKLVDCVSQINTGAKYNSDVFQDSIGLNGVGLKAVNALSSEFLVRAVRSGTFKEAEFADGVLRKERDGKCDEPDGTFVSFRPAAELFPNYRFDEKFLRRRMSNYAYLNSGLALILNGEKFLSRNGLLDLLNEKFGGDGEERMYEPIYHRGPKLEFVFCHTNSFSESYYSFVNSQYTNDGGTHQSAFREGILKGVNEFFGKSFEGDDVRGGIVGAIAVKLPNPQFEGQTKNKLGGNTEIRGDIVQQVKDSVVQALYKNQALADAIKEKIASNEKVRKEIQGVKKGAKEKARKVALKIPNLRDCKHHLDDGSEKGSRSMLFIAEGLSAAGSMISSRDVDTQAIFSIRGKPFNCHGKKINTVYDNEELYCLMKALGIEDGMEGLRYEKVVIATDADHDGLHIRNLLITFFLSIFEELVLSQHIYILETPLFRVRNKRETAYCYSEYERDQAQARLGKGKGCDTTRFKGLGEISPAEFGQFIGEDIRLIPVLVDNIHKVPSILDFYMGDNNQERRDHLMANLI